MAPPPPRSQRKLLEKVFSTALDCGFAPGRAETYGVWILCFARYCKAHNVDPPAAAQVPNFMAYLGGRSDLTPDEREHALDAVLFALTEVPDAFVSGAPPERTLPAQGASSSSGYAANAAKTPGGHALTHLLLETDVGLYDAVRLRIHDVDREERCLHINGDDGASRRVPLSDGLLSDLGAAARRALAHGSRHLFPDAYAKYVAGSQASQNDFAAPASKESPPSVDGNEAEGETKPDDSTREGGGDGDGSTAAQREPTVAQQEGPEDPTDSRSGEHPSQDSPSSRPSIFPDR